MTLTLAQISDLAVVVSYKPLVFDFPAAERYVTGGNAIVQRVLIAWARDGGLLELPGRTLDTDELAELRSALARIAEAEDFVQSVTLELQLDDAGTLDVIAGEVLIDGQTYPLEVATGDASAAILALGSATG